MKTASPTLATGENLVLGSHTLEVPSRPLVMGVLNVTPDSFSDGGRFYEPDRAIDQFHRLVDEGAEIVDIGGESSRPGAEPVDVGEEWHRVGPILARVAAKSPVPVSIDTYKAEVARRAVDSGAAIVNDISALRFDAEMAQIVAEAGVSLILMHMQGTPRNMQKNPTYGDVIKEVGEFLLDRARVAEVAGVPKEKIILDPGIGFGKTLEHNLIIFRQLDKLVELGYPVLAGASRKSFIKMILGENDGDRIEGSLVAAMVAASAGVSIIRVHDVRQTRRTLDVWGAIYDQDHDSE